MKRTFEVTIETRDITNPDCIDASDVEDAIDAELGDLGHIKSISVRDLTPRSGVRSS